MMENSLESQDFRSNSIREGPAGSNWVSQKLPSLGSKAQKMVQDSAVAEFSNHLDFSRAVERLGTKQPEVVASAT